MPSARDIAFIGCRLLALYFLYLAVLSIPQGLFSLSSAFGVGRPQGWQLIYEASLWLVLAMPILNLAMVLLLWFGAGWLSKEVAAGAPEAVSDWSPRSLLSVGVVLLGLILISFALPQIVLYLLYIADGALEAQTFQVHYLVSEIVQACVGIGLILGSQRITDFIARARRW
ncbi:hypothetical protein AAFN88_05695 [Pelagibius sp. CAU 1746]|uniref:hypothetical protein n=1 Tax=Pelagibius sp. CAU 1746 TaxID=3140370 RepID=UPI00325AFF77